MGDSDWMTRILAFLGVGSLGVGILYWVYQAVVDAPTKWDVTRGVAVIVCVCAGVLLCVGALSALLNIDLLKTIIDRFWREKQRTE